jgi:SAM-dependent methyltransferase
MLKASDVAKIYNLRATIAFDGTTYESNVSEDVQLISKYVPTDAYICDVGCGLAWHLEALARRQYKHLFGIDISERSLEQAAMRLNERSIQHINLIYGDVRHWRVAEFFDVVTAFYSSIGSFSDGENLEILHSIKRLVRPTGRAFLTCFCRDTAESLVGQFDVRYSAKRRDSIRSTVDYDSGTGVLKIVQESADGKRICEELRLFSASEITRIMIDIGFTGCEVTDLSRRASGIPYRPGVMLIDARN